MYSLSTASPTEDTAKHYINNVWAGLMWVLLYRGFTTRCRL